MYPNSDPYNINKNQVFSPAYSQNAPKKKLLNEIGAFEISPFGTYLIAVVDGTNLCRKYIEVLPQAKNVMNGTFFEEIKKNR
jgi:hypothetical protein